METVYIPAESDFKRWVKEAVQEYCQKAPPTNAPIQVSGNDLIGRKEVAGLLQVSLVTLTDWMKRGLPYHKQRGRVYFIKAEVLEYITENKPSKGRHLAINEKHRNAGDCDLAIWHLKGCCLLSILYVH